MAETLVVARSRLKALSRPACAVSAALAVLTAAINAHAYRPFDGTDADVADEGEFELELGPTHFYTESNRRYLIAPATVLNLGFARDFELVVDFRPFVGVEPPPGESRLRVLDTDILVKYLIRRGSLQGDRGVSIALESGPWLPEIQGETHFGAQADLIVSYAGAPGAVHFNEQVALSRQGNLDLFTSVILEGPGKWAVRPVAEIFAEHEFDASSTYSALLGCVWSVKDSLALDLGVRNAWVDGAHGAEVRFGFTWGISVWEPKPRAK